MRANQAKRHARQVDAQAPRSQTSGRRTTDTLNSTKSPRKTKGPLPTALPAKQLSEPSDGDDASDMSAEVATNAIAVGACVLGYWGMPSASTGGLFDALKAQTDELKRGEMTGVEEMLYCQAVTLQGIFAKLLETAANRDSLHQQQLLLTIAFKAQAQCRATLDTLGNIKNPRAATFVKQANIAQNQQVNNGAGEYPGNHARAREKAARSEQNELLIAPKETNGNSVDTRATGATGGGDSTLEAVGKSNRPRIERRKTSLIS